jgi:hypothetical protein
MVGDPSLCEAVKLVELRLEPSKFDACSPIAPFARLPIRMRRLFIVNLRSSRGAT